MKIGRALSSMAKKQQRKKIDMSVVKSFAKPHLKNVANGGPLTLEFDSSVFRNDEAVEKLAMLRRLVLVHGSKAVENSHSVAVDFIIIQVLAGLGDYNNAREMLKHLKIAVGEQGEPFNSMAQALEEQIDRLEKNNPKKQD